MPKPIILNLTNAVVQTQTANALLAVNASPIMSHAVEEIADIMQFTQAVNLNIGTLNPAQIEIFSECLRVATKKKVPVCFDPVGAGASKLRDNTTHSLLSQHTVAVIKGNASEIIATAANAGLGTNTIDSAIDSNQAIDAAKALSKSHNCVVAVTGETDHCIDGEQVESLTGGHALMSQVTGMGCIANAIIAKFLASKKPMEAAIDGLSVMNEAGKMAAKIASGPGSFMVAFIDALYDLSQ